jgi:hypothetical protein
MNRSGKANRTVLPTGRRLLPALAATIVVLTAAASAGAAVRNCHTYSTGPGWVTSVRNMSCRDAAIAWGRGDGDQRVSLHTGGRFRVGRFRCVTYANHTPPGPSDANVLVRCVSGGRAFRFQYAV